MSNELEKLAEEDSDIGKILEGDGLRAGYKIEIHFGPGRTTRKDYKALVLLMESGKFFHGGGDGQIYVCMDHRVFEKDNTTPPSALPILKQMAKEGLTEWGCGSPIVSHNIAAGMARCTGCMRVIDARYITGQIPFYGSTQELAQMIEILFNKLKSNADIYCKFDRQDLRYQMCEKKYGYDEARRLRGLFIYPLAHIIRDTANGASLRHRISVFLNA